MTDRRASALLLVIVALVALTGLHAPFTYDDKIEVVGNPALRALGNPAAIVAYNPARAVLLFTYAVNFAIGGFDVRGYHVVSALLHTLNTALALALARRLLTPSRALFAAACWGLHPMTTEAVTYITGRSDELVATWFFAATTLWIDDSRTPDLRKRVAAWALVLVGLATKETAIVLPILCFVVDWACVCGRRFALVDRRRYPPMGALVLAAGAVRVSVLGWPIPEVPRPLLDHVVSQAEVWLRYFQLWLIPWGQSILQPVPGVATGLGAVVLVAWVALGVLLARKGGLLAFAAALWALPLAVTSAFVLKETMAEHRAYLAGFGLWFALAILLPERRLRWAIPLVFAALTAHRNLVDWHDEPSLWGAAAARWPTSADAAYNHGATLRFARRCDEAIPQLERALSLDPSHVEALVELGICRAESHDPDGARAAWEAALRLRPGHCAALNDLAGLAESQGNRAAAASGYAGTLRACPDNALAHFRLALLYQGAHDATRAIEHFRAYLSAEPTGPYADRSRRALSELGAGG